MKKISKLIRHTPVVAVTGDPETAVGGLTYDSRHVNPGDCFFAIRGTQSDGHDYIPMAVERGAAAVVCERCPEEPAAGVVYVVVGDSSGAMADLAANMASYATPSRPSSQRTDRMLSLYSRRNLIARAGWPSPSRR